MRRVTAIDTAGEPAPDGFDAVAHVSTSLARVPWPWQVEVLLDLPLDQAARRLPGTLAELVDADGGTLLRMRVSSLDWMATVLARLDCAVHDPHAGGAAHERESAGRAAGRLGVISARGGGTSQKPC